MTNRTLTDRQQEERNVYTRSVWDAEGLTTSEKMLALAYARMAYVNGPRDVVVVNDLAVSMTGLAESSVSRVRKGLIAKGWLAEVKAPTPRAAGRYALRVPVEVHVSHEDLSDDDVQAIAGASVSVDGAALVVVPDVEAEAEEEHVQHVREPNARRALQDLAETAPWGRSVQMGYLIGLAYSVGDGDPWEGYLRMKSDLTERLPEAVRNWRAFITSRVSKSAVRRAS